MDEKRSPARMAKHIIKLSRSFEEADEWDIQQNLSMTPAERLDAARELQIQVFGETTPDVREAQLKGPGPR